MVVKHFQNSVCRRERLEDQSEFPWLLFDAAGVVVTSLLPDLPASRLLAQNERLQTHDWASAHFVNVVAAETSMRMAMRSVMGKFCQIVKTQFRSQHVG